MAVSTEKDQEKDENITIEQGKRFLDSADTERESWLKCAKRSWEEIKKVQTNGLLYSVMPNSARKRIRYPLWYSTWKLRRPMVYARTPIPIGLDELEGKDPIGETAAIMKERLALNLMKRSAFDECMGGARDDSLATQFGAGRLYVESQDKFEQERIYLGVVTDDAGNQFYQLPDGGILEPTAAVLTDENGSYIVTENLIAVENEKICSKHVIFRDLLIDPCAYRWSDVREIAFGYDYSPEHFRKCFGKEALAGLALPSERGNRKKKQYMIKVWEYWNLDKRQMGFLTAAADKFLKKLDSDYDDEDDPIAIDTEKDGTVYQDPYKLEDFWPCPKPMVFDQPSDSFWPISEWYQYCDLLEEIHNIASNIFILSRAVRIRCLFDNSIPSLQALVNESGQADWIGIDNLLTILTKAGGSLANVVAYLPIEPMVKALNELYVAMQQRLEKFGQLSGTSDLLQGKGDQVERTYGEQQMRAKFAMNQLEPYQTDMQRFAKDTLELMCEMALKNFSDDSLRQYIVPETMTAEHQTNYGPAMELLKNDRKHRFRIDLETDSTIALDEQYDMNMRKMCADSLSAILKTTAETIEMSPMLAPPLIEMARNVAQSFRQGKLFVNSMDASLEAVLKKAEELAAQPPPPPPFDKDQANANLEAQRIGLDARKLDQDGQIAIAEIQSKERIEVAKLNQQTYLQSIESQLEQLKMGMEQGKTSAELQLAYQTLSANVAEAQQKLALEREGLLVEIRKIVDAKEMKQFDALIADRFKPAEMQLEAQRQQIDQMELALRERDQMLEARQQTFIAQNQAVDNELNKVKAMLEAQKLADERNKPPEIPAITINMPEPKAKKKKIKITKRNADDEVEELEQTESEE
jgi:hypothetical protein